MDENNPVTKLKEANYLILLAKRSFADMPEYQVLGQISETLAKISGKYTTDLKIL
jgi:hypothetical protein